jgi:hypothetical protein
MNKLGSNGSSVDWERKMFPLYSKVARSVANKRYRKGRGDRRYAEPTKTDSLNWLGRISIPSSLSIALIGHNPYNLLT